MKRTRVYYRPVSVGYRSFAGIFALQLVLQACRLQFLGVFLSECTALLINPNDSCISVDLYLATRRVVLFYSSC